MGSSSRPASTTTSQVRQEYPEFFKPHLERVLAGAEKEFGRDYVPFPEPRLVETPAARLEALTALQAPELTDFSQPMFETALAGTQEAAKTFPETDIESYMNPYQQLVTDQLIREATERRQEARKGISSAAAKAGALGTRRGVTESIYDRETQKQLQDIQDRGQMAAFQNALAAAQADKTRGMQAALQTSQLGEGQRRALLEGQIGREKAATAEQALAQQERDIQYQEFQEQLDDPQQQLSEYSAIIRGHTPPTNVWKQSQIQESTSPLQQVAGLGALIGGGFGFGKKEGGAIRRVSGGEIDEEGNIIAGGYGDFEAGVTDIDPGGNTSGFLGHGPVEGGPPSVDTGVQTYGPKSFGATPSGMQETVFDRGLASLISGVKALGPTALNLLSSLKGPEDKTSLGDDKDKYDPSLYEYESGIVGPTARDTFMGTGKRDADPYKTQGGTDFDKKNTPTMGRNLPPSAIVNNRLLENREAARKEAAEEAARRRGMLYSHPKWAPGTVDYGGYGTGYGGYATGGPIKLAHGGTSQGSAEVQTYIDKLSDVAEELSAEWRYPEIKKGDRFGESTPDPNVRRGFPTVDEMRLRQKGWIRDEEGNIQFDEEGNPQKDYHNVVVKAGGSISDKNLGRYMREGSGSIPSKDRTRLKEMYQSGLQSLAYGGVPGQPYTEDIGMVGGLGAVAGPQMRFQGGGLIPHDQFVNSWMTPKVALAYGGVPGQPYTEDIGMTGGLGAVAGPQLRFDEGGGISDFLNKYLDIGDAGERAAKLRESNPNYQFEGSQKRKELSSPQEREGLSSLPVVDENGESVEFIQNIKDWWEPIRQSAQQQAEEFVGEKELQTKRGEHQLQRLVDYFTKVKGDPKSLANKKALALTTEKLEKFQKDIEKKYAPEEKVGYGDVDYKGGFEEGLEGIEIEDFEEKPAPESKKGKPEEAKTPAEAKKKWGPNWKLMGVGMQLLRGDKAGLDAASKIIEKMPTEGDKEMDKLKKDYLKAKTENAKSEASRKLLKMMWDKKYKNTEMSLKVGKLKLELQKANWTKVNDILKTMSDQEKMFALGLSEEEAELIEDKPHLAASIMRGKTLDTINFWAAIAEGRNPPSPPAKEPEPEEESTWYKPWTWEEGGAVPSTLREAGVTSIRKI